MLRAIIYKMNKAALFLFIIVCLSFASAFAENEQVTALAVSIASYLDGRVRTGGENSAQGVADALEKSVETKYSTTLLLDPTRDELLSAIADVLEASEGSRKLFYINCHALSIDGAAALETSDLGAVTALELEAALRKVPGHITVIIDCCYSGAFIGASEFGDRFLSETLNAFSGGGQNAFALSKYSVLASCSAGQRSYRVADGGLDEENVATVFSRALCEALGWDLINDRMTSLKADFNGDRRVTLNEAYLYITQRSGYYLSAANVNQSVQLYPSGCGLQLASRARSVYE